MTPARIRRTSLAAVSLAIFGLLAAASMGPALVAAVAQDVSLIVAPPKLLADGGEHSIVYVQLLDEFGQPQVADQPTSIRVVSSNPSIAAVPADVTIAPGESYAVTSLETSDLPGSATITATHPSGNTSRFAITTTSPPVSSGSLSLALSAAPAVLLPSIGPLGKLSVYLVDENERLTAAPEDIELVVASSDEGVARIAGSAHIRKGSTGTELDIVALTPGDASITVAANGYSSGFTGVQIAPPGNAPKKLRVELTRPTFPTRTTATSGIIIQALDTDGRPTVFPCAQVDIFSSNLGIAEVLPIAEFSCEEPQQYTTGTLRTGIVEGSGLVGVASAGLVSDDVVIQNQGHLPTKLMAWTAPAKLLSQSGVSGLVVVQLMNDNGIPLRASFDTPISVSGNEGSFPSEIVIPVGRSYVTVPVHGLPPGRPLDLWFVADESAGVSLSLTPRVLTATAELTVGAPVTPGGDAKVVITATSDGQPLPGASVQWQGNGAALSEAELTTDANGQARATFNPGEAGDATVSALIQKAGYDISASTGTIAVLASTETSSASAPRVLGVPVGIVAIAALVALGLYIATLLGLTGPLSSMLIARARQRATI